ncbi:MAG: glutamine synthetase [Candidatus Midichloriaceae bacterium]|jgi:glutamine synthetase
MSALLKNINYDKKIERSLLELKNEFGIKVKIGVEIEFYIRSINKSVSIGDDVDLFIESLKGMGTDISEEKGLFQFEVQIAPTTSIMRLIKNIERTKDQIVNLGKNLDLKVIYSPKPFDNTYGSSMHFHISIYDKKNYNIFGHESITTNIYLNSVIASILENLNPCLHLLCGNNPEEYSRFAPNFMSPVNVSWGMNNRTTAIRIPDSNVLNRRIEFRIPSASCDPKIIILFLLKTIQKGMHNKKIAQNLIYGIASDTQYDLVSLYQSAAEAAENCNTKILD